MCFKKNLDLGRDAQVQTSVPTQLGHGARGEDRDGLARAEPWCDVRAVENGFDTEEEVEVLPRRGGANLKRGKWIVCQRGVLQDGLSTAAIDRDAAVLDAERDACSRAPRGGASTARQQLLGMIAAGQPPAASQVGTWQMQRRVRDGWQHSLHSSVIAAREGCAPSETGGCRDDVLAAGERPAGLMASVADLQLFDSIDIFAPFRVGFGSARIASRARQSCSTCPAGYGSAGLFSR